MVDDQPTASDHGRVLVSGSSGFVGSHLMRRLLADGADAVGVDIVIAPTTRHVLNLCDADTTNALFDKVRPQVVMHLAAESNVDVSLKTPLDTATKNIGMTLALLEASRRVGAKRFVLVSTDEVFGSCTQPVEHLRPSSPYSASKAACEMLVNAWRVSFNLPTLVVRMCNNYGIGQRLECLIPRSLLKIATGCANDPVQIYGSGENIRHWMHVRDSVAALSIIARTGKSGECYNLTGPDLSTPHSTLSVVYALCDEYDRVFASGSQSRALIRHVADRRGHDVDYVVEPWLGTDQLADWRPTVTWREGITELVQEMVSRCDRA